MKRTLLFILMIAGIAMPGLSQTSDDALRFSMFNYQGTARSMAMGGAFSALGADFTNASVNPAGLGLYRKSEFSLTPEVWSSKVSSNFEGSQNSDNRTVFDLSNIGIVGAYKQKPNMAQQGFKYFQLAFGMNRMANFNQRSVRSGVNRSNSKLDAFADDATLNNIPIEDLGVYNFNYLAAFNLFLIDTDGNDGVYVNLGTPFPPIEQTEVTRQWGSMNEWLIGGAFNYDDVLFVGATLGLPYLRYFRETTYTERPTPESGDEIMDFWSSFERLETRGWGFNFKFGAIVWPVDWLRLGAAFHTPTWMYGLRDNYYTIYSIGPSWQDFAQELSDENPSDPPYTVPSSIRSPNSEFDYQINTPLRWIGSIGFIIGKYGLISAEYEYLDYSSSRITSRTESFIAENNEINNAFSSTGNVKIGAEFRYEVFSFRGGYAFYGSPYRNDLNDASRQSISGGLGIGGDFWGLDLTFVRTSSTSDFYFYGSENISVNPVQDEIINNQFLLTLRLRY